MYIIALDYASCRSLRCGT